MHKLEMRRVQGNPGDQPLGGFLRVILPVADHRAPDRRELRADLILQPRHQRNSDERGALKKPLYGISKFGASRFGVFLRAQPLKHPFASKVVNQSPLPGGETPANYRQVLPHRSMAEKLANEYLPIRTGFREEQNAGRESIDAMDDEGPLSLRRKSRGKQRQSGRTIGTSDRHSREARRLVEDHYGIVLVQQGKPA